MDGFSAAREIQKRVAAGEAVERELIQGLALAVLARTKAGRIALAVLRSASDEERLSWALDLTDIILEDRAAALDAEGRPRRA